MDAPQHLLSFRMDSSNFAFDLASIERIVPIAEFAHDQHSPELLLGSIMIEEMDLPILNIRNMLDLPKRSLALDDRIVIFFHNGLRFAVIVDSVIGVESAQTCYQTRDDGDADNLINPLLFDDEVLMLVNIKQIARRAAQILERQCSTLQNNSDCAIF